MSVARHVVAERVVTGRGKMAGHGSASIRNSRTTSRHELKRVATADRTPSTRLTQLSVGTDAWPATARAASRFKQRRRDGKHDSHLIPAQVTAREVSNAELAQDFVPRVVEHVALFNLGVPAALVVALRLLRAALPCVFLAAMVLMLVLVVLVRRLCCWTLCRL